MRISILDLKDGTQFVTTFDKGRAYSIEGRVNLLEADDSHLSACVYGHAGDYNVELSLTEDVRGKLCISSWHCTCAAYASYPDSFCKHIVAAALTFNDSIASDRSQLPARAVRPREAAVTTPAVRRLLEECYARPRLEAQSVKAILEPTLEISGSEWRLSFRVGFDRLYVMHSIREFISRMNTGSEYSYGKGMTLLHHPSVFRECDRPLLTFLRTEYDFVTNNGSGISFVSKTDRERYFLLRPRQIDAFISMWQGDSLRVSLDKQRPTVMPTVQGDPPIDALLVEEHEGQYSLSLPSSVVIGEGVDRGFAIYGNTLYMFSERFHRVAVPLIRAVSFGSGKVFIGEQDMTLAASALLPDLRGCVNLKSQVDLTPFEPLPLRSEIRLDAENVEGDDYISVSLLFFYGETEYHAFGEQQSHAADYAAEELARSSVLRCFEGGTVREHRILRKVSDDFLFSLITEWLPAFSSFAEVFCSDELKGISVKKSSPVSVGVRLDSGLLSFNVDMGEDERAELAEIFSSLHTKKRYHRMRDGSFLLLENSPLADLFSIADGLDVSADALASGSVELPTYRGFYLNSAVKDLHSITYERDNEFRQMMRELRNVADSDFDIPERVDAVLRPYQQTGYRWLRTLSSFGFGGILADDMGLGKTLQVLTLLASGPARTRSIVVCPSSLVLNWVSECERFTPGIDVVAISGSAFVRAELLEDSRNAQLIVTSYDALKRDIDLYRDEDFDYIIADEAQYMKNHLTQNAKAVKALKGRRRFALTGTPIENSLAELWSIFDFILPGYLFRYSRFRERFELPIVRDSDRKAAENLRRLVSPFMLRRLKKDVLTELPDKTETVTRVSMDDEQRRVYNANAITARDEILRQLAAGSQGRFQILALLTRLRQICCDPSLIYDNYKGSSAKLELCMELLDQCFNGGHKVLLFSQFTSMLAIIEQRLKAAGIPYYILTGRTNATQRMAMVTAFNSDDTPVFLISLKAGGTGLNLTGADTVIHYDPWWNISAQNQATDRAHRIGQKNSVQIYKLIVKDTIEERILALQQSKADLVEKIIEADGDALSTISPEELLALLEDIHS